MQIEWYDTYNSKLHPNDKKLDKIECTSKIHEKHLCVFFL